MLHRKVEIEKQDFRKDSSFFPNPADHKANLTLSPTTHYGQPYSRIEDYELLALVPTEYMNIISKDFR